MRSLRFFVLFLLVASTGVPAFAWDWYHPCVETEFKESDLVCTGKLLSKRDGFDREGFISGTYFNVQVVEMLKGTPSKSVELYCDNDSGRFIMDVGTSYLIFAYQGEHFDGIRKPCLTINAGGNSGALVESGTKLAVARALRTKYLSNPGIEPPNQPPNPSYPRLSVPCDFPQQYMKASRTVAAAAAKAGLNPYEYYVEVQAQNGEGLIHFVLWHESAIAQRHSENLLGDPSGKGRTALYDPVHDVVTKIYGWR